MLYRKKVSLAKKMLHLGEYLLVQIVNVLVNLIPYTYLDTVAKGLATVVVPIAPKLCARIRENVAFAFPEMSEADFRRFLKNNMRHSIRVSLEVFQSWKFRNKEFIMKYVHLYDEQSGSILTKRQDGLVCIQGHIGSWELPMIYFGHLGEEIAFAAKRMANPWVNRMLDARRQRYGGKVIYLSESKELLKELKSGNIVGLAADQDAGSDGVFIQFMGRLASTFKGPALLTYLAEKKLVIGECIFMGKGHYQIKILPVIEQVCRKDYTNKDMAIEQITQQWVAVLEQFVRQDPEQYFWLHRRWKTQPKMDAGLGAGSNP